tara:strand:+ start:442 stop:669 length:228 start_codon:yes stop_codon:yes gene_type:complete
MTKKGKNSLQNPTKKQISQGIVYLGQKVAYLEEFCTANEKVIDELIIFLKKKEKFLDYLKEKYPEKEVENEEKDK